jgi:hypothetical protein
MPLMTWAIGLACQNIQMYQNHQDACSRFFSISSDKIGLTPLDSQVENYYTVKATAVATDTLGKDAMGSIGGLGYGYRVYRAKSIDFKLPTLGIADKITAHAALDGGSVGLTWKMPWL